MPLRSGGECLLSWTKDGWYTDIKILPNHVDNHGTVSLRFELQYWPNNELNKIPKAKEKV